MGTFSQTFIRAKEIEIVLTELKIYLPIGRETTLFTRMEWFYNFQHENNVSTDKNLTLILTKKHSQDWVEIEFDFGGNLYFYDEILRRISKSLETEILIGYYQSTSGEGRLAKFKNGQLEISFYEKYVYSKSYLNDAHTISKTYLADNFGVLNSNYSTLKEIKIGDDSSLIYTELIYKFFESEGWSNEGKRYDNGMYLHIEQIR